MDEKEIRAFFTKEEVIDYLKKHICLDLSVEPRKKDGYSIKAKAYFEGATLAEADDCI